MNITGPVNITVTPIHGDCLTTAEAGRCNLLPCQASPSGVPLRGFRPPSSASRTKMALASDTPEVIMTLVSYLCGLPGFARKARKHYKDIGSYLFVTPSITHSFPHSQPTLTNSPRNHPVTHSPTQLPNTSTHSFTHSPSHHIYSLSHALTLSLHSLTHSLTHSFTHSMIHSITHSLGGQDRGRMCEKFHHLLAVGRWFPPGTLHQITDFHHHHFTALI